jgi:DNA polymerase-3 subunit epsilon
VRRVIPTSAQLTLEDLGQPLSGVTFVVVDLETTGGAPADAGITEFGAVRIKGGVVQAEFATLVNPGVPIPPFIASLTGITNAAVADAPRLEAVLSTFLEFASGAVLVAHNAPYDIGFLKGACAKLDIEWPDPVVLDTVRLARQILPRDEVRDCKLATLARHFHAPVEPTHRALADARATVTVLHALIERVGSLGVSSLEDLQTLSGRVTLARHGKRHLADGLPHSPGVYIFEAADGEALYVGTSKDLRTRVRTYFTASEQRARMTQMIKLAERVVPIVCATPLEAHVREIRTIADRQPRFNRRSLHPERDAWLKLTVEPYPRISIVRQVSDDTALGAAYIGPYRNRGSATLAAEALIEATGLRTCTTRLARAGKPRPTCVLADIGRCLAPCASPSADYADRVAQARLAMSGDVRPTAATVSARMAALAQAERYEDAALWRERLTAFAQGAARAQVLRLMGKTEQIIAASPTAEGGWAVHIIRHGRLAAAALVPPGVDPRPHIESLAAIAEIVPAPISGVPAALTEETNVLRAWLFDGQTRLVDTSQALDLPMYGGGGLHASLRSLPGASGLNPALEDIRRGPGSQRSSRARQLRRDSVA